MERIFHLCWRYTANKHTILAFDVRNGNPTHHEYMISSTIKLPTLILGSIARERGTLRNGGTAEQRTRMF